MKSSKS